MRHRSRVTTRAAAVLFLLGLTWTAALAILGEPAGAQDPERRVLVATLDSSVGPVTADHVIDGLERAARDGYEAYVLVMDTPGGLDTSMRKIIRSFLDADVPVVVHVAPRGARAASAGAIITYASHVAVMAPGTAIGAATPVDLEGGDIERKIVNDAAAMAESIARLRGRDVEFAVDSVRKGRSASADEALELGVIDLIASSLDELLEEVDGTEVEVRGGREVTLRTAGALVEEHEMGLFRRILRVLADPNLAFLFLSIGTLGVIYELASPGVGAGGVVGAVLIVLAMFALSVLDVNVVGLLFLLLAAILFVAELFAPGIGVFALLGAGALLLSGLFLFDDTSGVDVSLGVLLPTALTVGAATVLAGRLAWRARAAPSTTTGTHVFVGQTVSVRAADGLRGQAFVEGAWWTVRADQPLHAGQLVHVVAVDGLDLVVEPVDPVVTPDSPEAGESTATRDKGDVTEAEQPEERNQT
jgi:membrane-bound serine protease (ClpP class)